MAYLDLNGLKYFLGKLKPRLVPSGAVQAFAGASVPTGWLLCNGQAVSRSSYAALFGVIGTRYGSGDGKTTFNLPNLNGYTIIGGNSGDVGRKVGEITHGLTLSESASHTHDYAAYLYDKTGKNGWLQSSGSVGVSWNDQNIKTAHSGGGQPHNNMQPSVYMTYIIKV